MEFRAVFAGILRVGSMLMLTSLACGGAQQDDVSVQRMPNMQVNQRRQEVNVPDATVREMKDCVERAASRLTEASVAFQYTLFVNTTGSVMKVKLRDAMMRDPELEECFERALAVMAVPVDDLGLGSSRPISGGERMTREQRGSLGSSESESPLVFLGPLIVEAGGVQMLFEIGVMLIAAAATLTGEPDPQQECQDRYESCLMSHFTGKRGDKYGHTRCDWCRQGCVKNGGVWPSRTDATVGTVSCVYWRR